LAGFGRKHAYSLQARFSIKKRCGCALNAHVHQATECVLPMEAVDPPELPPSVLTMGIPCILPDPRYADFDGAQLSIPCITTECAKASLRLAICFGLAMMLQTSGGPVGDLCLPLLQRVA
jgi:hypothetical protein